MLPACAGDITSPGGTTGGAACGNGVVDTGEQCDDGNTAAGDGCSATCTTEPGATPKLDITVDMPSLSTELHSINKVNVTLTASGGFSGAVTLAGSALDGSNAAITGWTVSFDSTSVSVPLNGTATAVATLTIPSQNMGLAGTLKIDATDTLGTQSVMTAVTVANQVTYTMHIDLATATFTYPAVYATQQGNPDLISVGTKVRWYNDGTANFVVHIGNTNNGAYGLTHQGQSPTGLADPTTEPGTAYEQTATAASSPNVLDWYFHDPNDPSGTHSGYLMIVQ
jgi:cysteine-rich repeat protein